MQVIISNFMFFNVLTHCSHSQCRFYTVLYFTFAFFYQFHWQLLESCTTMFSSSTVHFHSRIKCLIYLLSSLSILSFKPCSFQETIYCCSWNN